MGQIKNNEERGNVLFLILIAVALFAALSYAVTQSTRGGGDADNETSLISSASLTQYPASLKTTLLRMQISDGVASTRVEFNPPSDSSNCTDSGANCIFNSAGGGASYQTAPSNVAGGASWIFNSNNDIHDVGTNSGGTPTAATAELIAFLPGISATICRKINDEFGITDIPTESGIEMAAANDQTSPDGSAAPTPSFAANQVIGDNVAALDGKPFGCFQQPAGTYHYYHALSEN